MGTNKRTGVKPIHYDKHFRKDGNREFCSKVRAEFRNEKRKIIPCAWCRRVIEISEDNYNLGAKMFAEGVEENCMCNE